MAKPDHETWYVGSGGFVLWKPLAALLAGPALLGFGRTMLPHGGSLPAGLMLAGALTLLVGVFWTLRGLRPPRGQVRIDQRGVHLGNEIIPRENIGRAIFVPASGSRAAHLALRSTAGVRLAEIGMASEEHARRFVETLALPPRPEAQIIRGVSPLTAKAGGAMVLAVLLGVALAIAGAPLHLPVLVPIGLGVGALFALLLSSATFFVGADGLRITTRLDDRFVPWSDVVVARQTVRGIEMDTRQGNVDLSVTSHFWPYYEHEKVAHASLWASVQTALAAFRASTASDAATLLERRGRPFDEWQRGLARRDGGGEGDFRTATIDDGKLWEVVESATAKPTARAAAAALLARGADEPARVRLRVASEASAAPRLRVVLDEAARGASEEELAQALAEVEDEDEDEDKDKGERPEATRGARGASR